MKIYNEIVFDVDGNVTYEDSYEYSGDVMLLQGDDNDSNSTSGLGDWGAGMNFNLDPYFSPDFSNFFSPDPSVANFVNDSNLTDNFTNFNLDLGFGGNLNTSGLENIDYSALPNITSGAGAQARSDELLMQSSGALTANPMPSLPSISNVGAAPFSGSINWNAIPGGFQPLPQVAGGKKKLYQLSKFHGGMNQKSSPRDISDAECQEATNVTVSQVGRITLLGDITNTENGLSTAELAESATHIPSPGYGLYVFKSGYSLEASPTQGDYTIVVSTDGEHVVAKDSTTQLDDDNAWLTISDATSAGRVHVAPVFYASGNGLYACDANLIHTATRKAAILVYRKDYNDAIITNVWSTGEALIASPTFIESAAGNSNNAANGKITLEWDDIGAGSNVVFDPVDGDGEAAVHIGSDADISGNWDGNYFFYISWLFDNGCETGLTSLQKTGGSFASGYPFSDESLEFNFSVMNNDNDATPAISGTNYMGGDARIHGARIYFREAGAVERYMLAEVSLPDGVKGALDSTFTPWDENSEIYDLYSNITFKSPPELYTYVALNGYYANEMYAKSETTIADDTAGPASHEVRYRTATVGSNGAVFIGCFSFRGKVVMDGMMYSMKNKPGVFPELNVFDSPSSDGTPITALVSFKDKILQFKQDAMYVVNISNATQFYTEASFRNCGIMNPCQAFQTPFGVIFANHIGCFIYDGSKVISLTSGKLAVANWGISEGSIVDTVAGSKDAVNVPCVGYDPRSQSIIVLKDIGDDSTDTSAWVYHMGTQSWTEGTSMITNTNSDRHSNFIISPNGYLSICQDAVVALKNYNHDKTVDTADQTITYTTKDMDFGMPSQTKKVFKVYVTYFSDDSTVPTLTFGVDGDTTPTEAFDSGAFASSGGLQTTAFTVNDAALTGIKSLSLKISGATDHSFEIQDISILYRPRPIK